MPDKKSRTATNSMITAGGKGRSRGARGTSNVSNYNAYTYHLELMYIGKDSEKNLAINCQWALNTYDENDSVLYIYYLLSKETLQREHISFLSMLKLRV